MVAKESKLEIMNYELHAMYDAAHGNSTVQMSTSRILNHKILVDDKQF